MDIVDELRGFLPGSEYYEPFLMRKAADEIEELRRWKAEAMQVHAKWEETWVAAGRPGRLGASKAESVRDEIERLRGEGEWEYYATARKGYVAGEPRVHERGAIQAYEEALDQVVFEQEDETPVVFKRRVGPWEVVEGDTLARHARDSGA